MAWRVAVNRDDAERVRSLALDGEVLTRAHVLAWFTEYAKSWPEPPAGTALDEFLRALNVLRVTRSRTTRELQSMTPERAKVAKSLIKITAAIETLATELPSRVVTAKKKSGLHYTDDEMLRLTMLAAASLHARGIIKTREPPNREAAWHGPAQLIEWHIRRILAQANISHQGDSWNGPLVMVVKAALATVEVSMEPEAIAKALQRAAAATVRILSPDEKGRLIGHAFVA